MDHFRRVSREAPLGEGADEGLEHSEFFERPDPGKVIGTMITRRMSGMQRQRS